MYQQSGMLCDVFVILTMMSRDISFFILYLNNHYFNSISQYVENGEEVNILHYEVGQMYVPHTDYFDDAFNIAHGGQRIATMLMYL
jgi:hypothetical protein